MPPLCWMRTISWDSIPANSSCQVLRVLNRIAMHYLSSPAQNRGKMVIDEQRRIASCGEGITMRSHPLLSAALPPVLARSAHIMDPTSASLMLNLFDAFEWSPGEASQLASYLRSALLVTALHSQAQRGAPLHAQASW